MKNRSLAQRHNDTTWSLTPRRNDTTWGQKRGVVVALCESKKDVTMKNRSLTQRHNATTWRHKRCVVVALCETNMLTLRKT